MTYNVFSGTLNPTHSLTRPVKLSDEVVMWLSIWSEVQMICMWSSWCHCHPIISCFIKIQFGITFLVPGYPGCPGKEVVKRVPVCLSIEWFSFCRKWPSFQSFGNCKIIWGGAICWCMLLLVMVALCNRANHYIFALWTVSIFYLLLLFFLA